MMKPSSFILLISMLAFVLAGPTACKSKAQKEQELQAQQEQRLHGVWFLDADATVAQMPEEQQAMAGAFIRMMKIGMIFNENETLEMHVSMMGQKDFQEGGFKILEYGDDQMTIELSRDEVLDADGNIIEDEPSKMIVTFLEDERISFKPVALEGQTQEEADDETLILKRITREELDKELAGGAQPSLDELGLDLEALMGADEEAEDVDAEDADAEDADAEEDEGNVYAEDADAEDAEEADAAE